MICEQPSNIWAQPSNVIWYSLVFCNIIFLLPLASFKDSLLTRPVNSLQIHGHSLPMSYDIALYFVTSFIYFLPLASYKDSLLFLTWPVNSFQIYGHSLLMSSGNSLSEASRNSFLVTSKKSLAVLEQLFSTIWKQHLNIALGVAFW